MNKRSRSQIWQSLHLQFLSFAFFTLRNCKWIDRSPQELHLLNRPVVETIRYAFDALEASVEFIYHMGQMRQLHIRPSENWLTGYVKRKWKNLSISDRMGVLPFAWAKNVFWESEKQFILFEEVKKIRDGLTHARPFCMEEESEILLYEELKDGSFFTQSKPLGRKYIGPSQMVFSSKNSIAKFSEDPLSLNPDDASKSFEIVLHVLSRLEKIFFKFPTTWFSIYDTEQKKALHLTDMLNSMGKKFTSYWPNKPLQRTLSTHKPGSQRR